MALPNIFSSEVTLQLVGRINQLSETSRPKWGKMDAAQMLAHCNVTYEMCFENKHKKPGAVKAFLLKTFVKKLVTNETPYKHNSQTAPEFLIKSSKDFQAEKTRLINYLEKAVEFGGASFHNKDSHSFGKLNTTEWNNMFYKHLDHHLTQFNV
jgi:hypothetical protein